MRRAAAGALATVLAVALAPGPSGAGAAPEAGATGGRHSSDGLPGETARPLPAAARRVAVRTQEVTWQVAPGLRYRGWTETDARGPVRVHLLAADLRRPGLRLEYAGAGRVARRAPLVRLVRRHGGVAGVNGDFFDIADTGAPLGVGVGGRLVRHGPRTGWTSALVVLGRSDARVGRAPVRARVVRGPRLRVERVNSPHVPPGGIGLYTARWGGMPGYAVTDGAARGAVRQVVVRRGRVVANTRRLATRGEVRGTVLVGRGRGAALMARHWPAGTRLRLRVTAAGSPRVAIGGSEVVLRGGRVRARDDVALHPRTAVGVDRATGRLLLVVVDGRSAASRGMTLVELAELLATLGADAALNLDGGGSSTMVARTREGAVRRVNVPSAGRQRPVPNGLVLTWRR